MNAAEYQHFREHGGVLDLSGRTKLRVTGGDRVRYLNGQVTANVMKLSRETVLPACVTTAKGKLSAEVYLSSEFAAEPAIVVDAEADLRETLPARLERYIVADDVILEDATDALALLHFVGPSNAGDAFGERLAPATVRRGRRFGALGWEALLEPAAAAAFLAEFSQSNRPRLLSPELAETIRLEAGCPRWGSELTDETLPAEAGLDRTHIDFAKGCYIGQEVISRIKSVGHVNRQLLGFISIGSEPLQAGWSLFAPDAPEKPVGELTSAGWSFALAKPVALGYLRRGSPTGALLARPADSSAAPVEVTPAELPLAVHFP